MKNWASREESHVQINAVHAMFNHTLKIVAQEMSVHHRGTADRYSEWLDNIMCYSSPIIRRPNDPDHPLTEWNNKRDWILYREASYNMFKYLQVSGLLTSDTPFPLGPEDPERL